MLQKVKKLLKVILTKLRVIGQERNEYSQFKNLNFRHDVKIQKVSITVHIIGCGAMGRHIASVVNSMDTWSVKSIFDYKVEAMTRLGSQLGYPVLQCNNFDEFLSQISKDELLIIATTANSHFEITKAAMKAGLKKIFLEKPVCTSLFDAQELIDYSRSANSIVYVDHLRRWSPTSESISRLVSSNVVGKMISIHYIFGRSGFAMIGTHLFDFFRQITSSNIKQVRGVLDTTVRVNWRGDKFIDPSGSCDIIMENGVKGRIDLSDDLELQQDYFLILFERGRLEVDQRNERIRLTGVSGVEWVQNYPWKDMLTQGIAVGLYELAQGVIPRCSLADGAAALEAVVAVHESNRQGGIWTDLPLKGDILKKHFDFA